MKAFSALVVAVSVSVVAISGCHVTDHGNKGNVDISTPFGGMQVKTDNKDDAAMIGLSIYPGAMPAGDKDSDHDSANVNFSFGVFKMTVKAASYQSADSSDKVIAFYRKDMAKYGDVIECQNDKPIGTPVSTSQGLTCDEQNRNDIHTGMSDHNHEIELRTGSKHLQHIVGVQPKDGGTRIGMVYLSLPHGSNSNDKTAE